MGVQTEGQAYDALRSAGLKDTEAKTYAGYYAGDLEAKKKYDSSLVGKIGSAVESGVWALTKSQIASGLKSDDSAKRSDALSRITNIYDNLSRSQQREVEGLLDTYLPGWDQ